MLTLKNIGKDYASGHAGIHALRCVNLVFRRRELVMVVGGNGSGKSTLLRILSAQIPASRGEMIIDGQATRKYSTDDWSAYRRRVRLADVDGMLRDRTVLENGELSLQLAGFGRHGRREQALEMLRFFGLESLADRYPGDLSRAEGKLAALACALASEPDVLLVDEPVLGLDAVSAKKVAGVLHETARHCLVITASRKPIFFEGDVRTVRLKDGTVESDTDPSPDPKETAAGSEKRNAPKSAGGISMWWKGLRCSGARVPARVLTAFAASFCAALVLVLAGAVLNHSAAVQQSTLSVYPIHLTEDTVPADMLPGLYESLTTQMELPEGTEILPTYGAVPWVFSPNSDGTPRQVNPTEQGEDLWTELPDDPSIRRARYQLVNGRWPERHDEVVVIQNTHGDYCHAGLISMGIQPDSETGAYNAPSYDEFLHTTFRLVLPTETYYPNADGTWGSLRGDPEYMSTLMAQVPSLKIVGIVRPADNTADIEEAVFIGYTRALTAYMSSEILTSQLVAAQEANPAVDVLTGLPFDSQGLHRQSPEHKAVAMLDYVVTLDAAALRELYREITGQNLGEGDALQIVANAVADLPAEDAAALYDQYVASRYSPASYDENMELFGAAAVKRLTELRLYTTTLSARQQLSALLDAYSETLTYSDEAEPMVASAESFAAGLERVCILLVSAAVVLALISVAAIHAVVVRSRRSGCMALLSLGLSRRGLIGLYFWEALALTLVPAALGVTAAWLLAGPLCRLSGWPQLAGSCALPLWQAAATTGALVIVSVLSAAGTAMSLAAEWPGELLQNGKE